MTEFTGHDYHEGRPGYSANQLLHDGCKECERRSTESGLGIAHLDPIRFEYAWNRAYRWRVDGLDDVAEVEKPMLGALWSVQVQLEQRGVIMGYAPRHVVTVEEFSTLAKSFINTQDLDRHVATVINFGTEDEVPKTLVGVCRMFGDLHSGLHRYYASCKNWREVQTI